MKKLGAGCAVFGVFLIIAVGCGSSESSSSGWEAVSTVPGIEIGMSQAEVIAVLGSDFEVIPRRSDNETALVYYPRQSNEIVIWLTDDKVTSTMTK